MFGRKFSSLSGLMAALLLAAWMPVIPAAHAGDHGGHYAYYGLGLFALGLYGHHYYGHHYYGHHYYGHYYYGHHYYTPYYGYYSYPGYSIYPYAYGRAPDTSDRHENGTYRQQDNLAGARIAHVRDGWKLLKEHRPDDALNAFAIEAQEHPTRGMPKVGYALAAAENGQLDRGVWAMRRALRFEPEALHYMNVDKQLQKSIRELIHRYDYDSASEKATDAAFMRAALHYLLREDKKARAAMDQALRVRDDSASAKNLGKLIREM